MVIRLLIVIFFFQACLTFSADSPQFLDQKQSSEHNQNSKYLNQPKGDRHTVGKTQFDAAQTSTPKTQLANTTNQQTKESGDAITVNTDKIQLLFSLALTITTILLWLVTRQSANAATKSANIAERALQVTQRAFIFSPEIDTPNYFEFGTNLLMGLHVMPRWRNSGTTPAKRCASYFDHKIIKANEPINIEFESSPTPPPTMDIGPGATISGNFVAVSNNDLVDIFKKEKRIFVWGSISYEDIFEHQHITKFCLEGDCALDPRTPFYEPNRNDLKFIRFRPTSENNFSD